MFCNVTDEFADLQGRETSMVVPIYFTAFFIAVHHTLLSPIAFMLLLVLYILHNVHSILKFVFCIKICYQSIIE